MPQVIQIRQQVDARAVMPGDKLIDGDPRGYMVVDQIVNTAEKVNIKFDTGERGSYNPGARLTRVVRTVAIGIDAPNGTPFDAIVTTVAEVPDEG